MKRGALAVLAVAFVAACTSEPSAQPTSQPTASETVDESVANEMFSNRPYMGVSCHVPNSTKCDRVGLAVWLADRATSFRATLNGSTIELRHKNPDDSRGFYHEGFFQPAGLHAAPFNLRGYWDGDDPIVPPQPVALRIVTESGAREFTLEVGLAPGWG